MALSVATGEWRRLCQTLTQNAILSYPTYQLPGHQRQSAALWWERRVTLGAAGAKASEYELRSSGGGGGRGALRRREDRIDSMGELNLIMG